MKLILYILLALLVFGCLPASVVQAQSGLKTNSLYLVYEGAFQEHERRMFDWPSVPQNQWGTYQVSVGIGKTLLENEQSKLFVSAAYSLEVNTFARPFSHCEIRYFRFDDGGCPYVFMYSKRNSYHLVRLNPALQYNLYRSRRSGFRVFLHASAMPSFQFRQSYSNYLDNWIDSHGKWKLAFFSLEAMGGPGFSIRETDISFYYRMYNYRRVDRILFYKPWQIPEDYEERNLFKVGVMVSTPLPEFKWLRKKRD